MKLIKLLVFVVVCLGFVRGEGSQPTVNTHIDLGNRHASSGNYSQALDALNQAISTNPTSARAYKIRGHVYFAMGNYDRALMDLDHVVALASDSALPYIDRAIIHSAMGHHGLALADVERALALKPTSSHALEVRNEILKRAK